MDREELRHRMLDGIEKALHLGVLVHHDTRVLLMAVKGVLAVDAAPADGFIDEVLKGLPKGFE